VSRNIGARATRPEPLARAWTSGGRRPAAGRGHRAVGGVAGHAATGPRDTCRAVASAVAIVISVAAIDDAAPGSRESPPREARPYLRLPAVRFPGPPSRLVLPRSHPGCAPVASPRGCARRSCGAAAPGAATRAGRSAQPSTRSSAGRGRIGAARRRLPPCGSAGVELFVGLRPDDGASRRRRRTCPRNPGALRPLRPKGQPLADRRRRPRVGLVGTSRFEPGRLSGHAGRGSWRTASGQQGDPVGNRAGARGSLVRGCPAPCAVG